MSTATIRETCGATVAAKWPRPGYFDVIAVGVNRHARSPDAARRLAEWLVDGDAQAAQFTAIGLRPANPAVPGESKGLPAPARKHNAGVFGYFETEAIKLAERARWY